MAKVMNWEALNKIFNFPKDVFHPMNVETALFDMARKFSNDDRGGQWTVETVGDVSIVVPPSGTYNVEGDENYYSGVMDAMTFGAALTLLLFNRMLFDYSADPRATNAEIDKLSEQFYDRKSILCNTSRVDAKEVYRFLD